MSLCRVVSRGGATGQRGVFAQAIVVLAVIVGSVAFGSDLPSESESVSLLVETAINPRGLALPEWVQSSKSAPVWPLAIGKPPTVTTIPAFQTLRVFDAQDGRLLVSADFSQPVGWIDISAVLPADPPAFWLKNHLATQGFRDVDGDVPRGRPIAQFTDLRQVGPQEGTRLPIQVDPREGDNPIIWVDAAALGPVDPPARLVYTGASSGWASLGSTVVTRAGFINTVGQAARESQLKTGVPASVTVAQAILESDWGESALARDANNYFGIKATGEIGNAGVVWMRTWEVIGGRDVFLREPFRAYHSLQESIDDHARLFTGLRLYATAMNVARDPLAFASAIHRAGYSTDPNYVSKLIQLMERHNLSQFNQG
ncbi:MAG: glycoside hydrolase family 73 protein [Chloroflexota bacterium]